MRTSQTLLASLLVLTSCSLGQKATPTVPSPTTDNASSSIDDQTSSVMPPLLPSGMQTYHNDKNGYSMDYPQSLVVRPLTETDDGVAFTPADMPQTPENDALFVSLYAVPDDLRPISLAPQSDQEHLFSDVVKAVGPLTMQGVTGVNAMEPVPTQSMTCYKTTWQIQQGDGGQIFMSPPTVYCYFDDSHLLVLSLNGRAHEQEFDAMAQTLRRE